MIRWTWLGSALRPTAALLAAALLSGCTTQKVLFTSMPPVSTVTVGDKQGVTPCTLRVAKEEGPAVFRLPSGEEKVVPLHGLDSHAEEAAEASGKVLGGTLKVLGGATALVGLGALFLASLDDDDDTDEELVLFGLGSLGVGISTYALGEWIDPDSDEAEIHVDFSAETGNDSAADTLYDDPGYGARRLKQAAP